MDGPPPLNAADILEHEAFVRGLARAALGGDDQVDDVVQETLTAGLTRRGGPVRNVRAWLTTVTRRRSVDLLRREVTRRRHEEVVRRAAIRSTPAPEDILAHEEARRALVEELVALDAPSREVLVLRYFEDLPPRDIAARLGAPVETVRTRTKRALARLRERLDARHGGDRSRWAVPLASAVGFASTAAVVASSTGGGVLPWLLGAAAVVLLGTGAVLLMRDDDEQDPSPEPLTLASGSADRPRLEGSGRALAAAPLESATSRILGWVTRNGHPVTATVELRRVPGIGRAELRVDPWAGGEDALHDAQAPPLLRASTDPRGAYVFDRLSPGVFWVRAVLSTRVSGSVQVRIGLDGIAADGRLEISEGTHSLVGQVVGPDGVPTEARVEVSAPNAEFRAHGVRPSILTDASGRFVVERLAEGQIGVTVHPLASGMTYEYESIYIPADGLLTIKLRPPLAAGVPHIRGRVVGTVLDPEGRPVTGVLVRSESRSRTGTMDASPGPSTVSDPTGRFALEGLGAGFVRLVVHDRGWTTPGLEDARGGADPLAFATDPDGRATVVLRVARSGALRGSVRDQDGAPMGGAEIVLRPLHDESSAEFPEARGVSATDGTFVIDTAPADTECVIEARSPELASPILATVRTPATGDAHVELEGLRLDPARWVEVEVRDDATDDPLPGMRVRLLEDVDDDDPDPLGPDRGVDDAGRVLLGPLPTGELFVEVHGPGVSSAVRAPVALPRTIVKVRRAGFIQGRVLLPRGHNAFFVTLALEPLDPGLRLPEGFDDWGDVDHRDGSFVLSPLPAGRWRIRATDTMADPPLAGEAVVETGMHAVRLRLEPEVRAPSADEETSWIEWRIRVLDPTGAHVPSASVSVWSLSPSGEGRNGLTVMAPNGERYRRLGGPTSTWFEVTEARDAQGRSLPLGAALAGPHDLSKDGGAIEFRLTAGKRIRGVVRDQDGVPVRGAEVSASALWPGPREVNPKAVSLHARTLTGEDGVFDLGGLGDVDYELGLELPRGLLAKAAPPVVRGGAADVVLAVVRAVSPVVVVLDERGDPIAGVPVRAVPAGRKLAWHEWDDDLPGVALAATDASGSATLRGLAPDRPHVLAVGQPRSRDRVFPQEINPWMPADTTVRARKVLEIQGRVLDPDGAPIPRAKVHAVGGQHFVEGDAEGRFRLAGLEPGTYRLNARHGSMPAGEALEAAAGQEGVVLTAPRGLVFEVRIADWTRTSTDSDFRIVDGAGKHLLGGGGRTPDEHGVLRWEGYPAGSLLALRLRTRNNAFVATARDVLVGEPTTVRLEPGAEIRGRLIGPGGSVPPNPRLGATGEEGLDLELELQTDGSFVIQGVKRGERVRVRGSGGPLDAQRRPTWSTQIAHVEDGRSLDLEVRPP